MALVVFLDHYAPWPVFMNIDKDPIFDAKFQHFEVFFFLLLNQKIDILHNEYFYAQLLVLITTIS